MSIGSRIQKRREELGLTQTDLAKRAGLKPPAISQYESGARSPSYEALVKLSNALDVTIDFLVTGESTKEEVITDQVTKVLSKIIQGLTVDKRDHLLQYAISLANTSDQLKMPILNHASEYADYILKKFTENPNDLPVNPYDIAEKLDLNVMHSNISNQGEGMLIKGDNPFIILDSEVKNEARKKFTLATLIGHAVIPWHVKNNYTIRKKGSSTLLTEDIFEMEANEFAVHLLMPRLHLERDLNKNEISIETLKKLADDKYKVSLFALANRLIELNKDKYALVQSSNWSIKKTYPGNRPLKSVIHEKSMAASFFENPSQEEETRTGEIIAACWFEDAKADEVIYEESIYNPKFDSVLTLLKIL
jgi:transcriptional regulator with XRE-family HTH domain